MKAAEFKAIREIVGASQQDVANALGVDKRSVKRWEASQNAIPDDASRLIADWFARFRIAVDEALYVADGIENVQLTYYRSQVQYDAFGRDYSPVGMVNAISREVALVLMDSDDVVVDWSYPDDDDNIYHKSR